MCKVHPVFDNILADIKGGVMKPDNIAVRDLLITKENHSMHDRITDRYSYLWDAALKAMEDVNIVLSEMLENNNDNGAIYHSWLQKFGIAPETENGWWSLAAIDKENISAFVAFHQDESNNGWREDCRKAIDKIADIRKIGDFKAKGKTVMQVVYF